jgi:thioredoxin 1
MGLDPRSTGCLDILGEIMKSIVAAVFSIMLATFSIFTFAAEIPFNQAQFDAARAAGKPVAVVFHADWCPTCRAQAPLLKELAQSPGLKPLTLYVANYDTEKALKKSLGVTQQSTIVVFKDGKESARSTGDTQRDSLAELLHHAIS